MPPKKAVTLYPAFTVAFDEFPAGFDRGWHASCILLLLGTTDFLTCGLMFKNRSTGVEAMRRIALAVLVISLLPSGSLVHHLSAQTPSFHEANEDEKQPAEVSIPESTEDALKGVMILRVSERYLKELFARDIDKRMPVTRVILGTRARGTAHTKGRADVNTKPAKDDAAFYVRISGSTTSRTVGHNGPAIIHSHSVTTWTAQKIVRFDGGEFVTSPATITSKTNITPLGADSSLPGLRGRLVTRIATRRAIELNCTAERLSGNQTEAQVLADVNRIVDGRLKKLNERIESRPIMSFLLPKLDSVGIKFSTSSNCINISFAGGENSPLARVCPVHGVDPSDTELWFQTALISKPEGEIPQMIDDAGAWVAEMLPDIKIPFIDLTGEDGVIPVNVEVVDGWVVFRSRDLKDPAGQNTTEESGTN